MSDREFLKLWSGQTVSLIGSQVTLLALPLTAVLVLQATPGQMGILRAALSLPSLLAALVIGAWVDRVRRKPVLIVADLGRAALLCWIPAAAVLDVLTLEQLYIVGFLAGILSVLSLVASMAFLPTLVTPERLLEANSKIQVSVSLASIVGPSLAGWIVQVLTAPVAIALDALSFVVSGVATWLIHTDESPPPARDRQHGVLVQIGEGLAFVIHNGVLRAIAGFFTTYNFFFGGLVTLFILYASRELSVPPAALGVIFAASGPGLLLGALVAQRLAGRYGIGACLVGGGLVSGAASLAIPFAVGPTLLLTIILATAQFVSGCAIQVVSINQMTVRQTVTPVAMQGRMNATMRFLAGGFTPLGALASGVLGDAIGLRPTLGIDAAGMLGASIWLLSRSIRSL